MGPARPRRQIGRRYSPAAIAPTHRAVSLIEGLLDVFSGGDSDAHSLVGTRACSFVRGHEHHAPHCSQWHPRFAMMSASMSMP